MSVYSMTGYAAVQSTPSRAAQETDAGTAANARLGIEIRSVNSRFLDLAFRLPDELRQTEPVLRELL
ncbi:MAG: YicC/YloC family endoribonuclease, partial [Polaromonas sp.]|nr:YicC/YloC family endoribonuclease [Polaromonas sp.]